MKLPLTPLHGIRQIRRFVGIDLALGKTGIIILECKSLADTAPRVLEYAVNTDKLKLGTWGRWEFIAEAVRTSLVNCTYAAIEGYAMQGKGRSKIPLAEIGGIVRLEMYKALGEKWCEIPPTQAKAFSGMGDASKKEVLANVKRWWNYTTKNDNLADAYTLAKIAQCRYAQKLGKVLTTVNSGLIDFQIDTLSRITGGKETLKTKKAPSMPNPLKMPS